MAVTLEAAKANALEAVDLSIINEFQVSELLDLMPFDEAVSPVGGGGTLTYSYRRESTTGKAAFRAINSEYEPSELGETTRHSVDLHPLGGSFDIDRVLAKIGPVATNEVSRQMAAKIEATRAEFANAFIHGDDGTVENSFDGISKALTDTSTELEDELDWSGVNSTDQGFNVMDQLDEFLSAMKGQPTALIGNKRTIAKITAAVRRASAYTEKPGPLDTVRRYYGSIALVDAGQKAGTNEDIIPVTDGKTELYAVKFGLDDVHGVIMSGVPLISYYLPDFTTAGAVKRGEVEMGPVAVAIKRTKSIAVARNIRLTPAG